MEIFFKSTGGKKPSKRGTLKKIKLGNIGKLGSKGIVDIGTSDSITAELKILEAHLLKLKKEGKKATNPKGKANNPAIYV